MPTITGSTAGVDSRVASARLTWNSARASRSRALAICVRDRWIATSWPTMIPTNSRTMRLSHSFGSLTVSVYSGRTNRKSYSRNAATAATIAPQVPATNAVATTAAR